MGLLPTVTAACAAGAPVTSPCAALGRCRRGGSSERSAVQTLALCYWSFHYVKRLLETFLVHK
jgi:hypothetical protein